MKKLFIISTIIFIVCIIRTFLYVKDSFNTKKIESISNSYVIPSKEYSINFKRLKEYNSDIVGILEIVDLDIKYLVVKGNNNSYYLNHNLDKKYSGSGWIFMDYRNNVNDKNIIIYGHNMKDGSMFGRLKNIFKNRESDVIYLTFEDGKHEYRVFSTYISEYEDYYLSTLFESDIDFSDYLNVITGRSNYDYDVSLNTNDSILTLSTCYRNTDNRVVVHAYKVY